MPPWISWHRSALQVGAVPRLGAARTLHQRRKPLAAGGISSVVEIEQIERAGEALNLDVRRLDLRLAEVAENAWADEAHDEADDRDDHEDLHQGEARLPVRRRAPAKRPSVCSRQRTGIRTTGT